MKSTTIFTVAALLAANLSCGGGKGIVDPPPPPTPPSLNLDPANPTELTVPGKVEFKFTTNTTNCSVSADRSMNGDVLTAVNSCGHWNFEATQVGSGVVKFTITVNKDGLVASATLTLQVKAMPSPVITPDPSNLTEWVVSSTQTMKFSVTPATSTCTAIHDNAEPIAGTYQNRTVIQGVTNSGVTVVVQNSIFKGKPNLTVMLSCVNGSSAATVRTFNHPLVSAPLVITGTSVVRSIAGNGNVIYELTFTGSGFSTYNGDTGFSYTGTLCSTDGRVLVGVRWDSPTKIVYGIGGGPDFNWSGNHTYTCTTSDPRGSSVSGTFVVP